MNGFIHRPLCDGFIINLSQRSVYKNVPRTGSSLNGFIYRPLYEGFIINASMRDIEDKPSWSVIFINGFIHEPLWNGFIKSVWEGFIGKTLLEEVSMGASHNVSRPDVAYAVCY